MIAAITIWKVAGWVAVCALGLAIWLWIESELHARRLRKMQRETDEKRNSHLASADLSSFKNVHSGFIGGGQEDGPVYSPQKRARHLP
jgi:hypothetical protein